MATQKIHLIQTILLSTNIIGFCWMMRDIVGKRAVYAYLSGILMLCYIYTLSCTSIWQVQIISRDRVRYKEVRVQYRSSFWKDPLVLQLAKCIAPIHTRPFLSWWAMFQLIIILSWLTLSDLQTHFDSKAADDFWKHCSLRWNFSFGHNVFNFN